MLGELKKLARRCLWNVTINVDTYSHALNFRCLELWQKLSWLSYISLLFILKKLSNLGKEYQRIPLNGAESLLHIYSYFLPAQFRTFDKTPWTEGEARRKSYICTRQHKTKERRHPSTSSTRIPIRSLKARLWPQDRCCFCFRLRSSLPPLTPLIEHRSTCNM
jgi:hypothetical protein